MLHHQLKNKNNFEPGKRLKRMLGYWATIKKLPVFRRIAHLNMDGSFKEPSAADMLDLTK